MNNYLLAVLLSILPVSEVRGGIPYAIKSGINPLTAFLLLALSNSLVVLFVFFFLDNLHHHCLRIRTYESLFNKYIEKIQRKFEPKIGIKSYFALFLFVLLPLPSTGAYTGALIAWFFKMNRKHSFLAISMGVFGASLIMTLVSLGIISLF